MTEPASALIPPASRSEALPGPLRERIAERIAQGSLDIPMLPQVAGEILAQGSAEGADVRRLSDLLHRDQALAGHVLRVANSAAFGGDVRIQSIQQALIRIGLVQMREIVVTVALHGKVFRSASHQGLTAELWRHATLTGLFAKEIARQLRANVEAAFVCGLLHDVGKPVVLGLLLDVCKETRHTASHAACEAILEDFHVQVGSLLGERWALPDDVRQAIAHHHETETPDGFGKFVRMTALADVIAYAAAKSDEEYEVERGLLAGHPLFAALNLYPDDVEALFAKRAAILAHAQAFTS
ncbi:MAG: HDOD domain-containing protein [Deltaproteobacteria bacterium]|nr:HDOD domain-containing protein [Deltaproteobacteria bacterium]